jgi:hypothetical protein
MVHFLPNVVVIIDEAQLPEPAEISLRWHTIVLPDIHEDGSFMLETEISRLAARVASWPNADSFLVRKHEYRPPYDRGRGDIPLDQQNEPYVEVAVKGRDVRLVSMFTVGNRATSIGGWKQDSLGWMVDVGANTYRVGLSGDALSVANLTNDTRISMRLL